jgi:hypothetical protein
MGRSNVHAGCLHSQSDSRRGEQNTELRFHNYCSRCLASLPQCLHRLGIHCHSYAVCRLKHSWGTIEAKLASPEGCSLADDRGPRHLCTGTHVLWSCSNHLVPGSGWGCSFHGLDCTFGNPLVCQHCTQTECSSPGSTDTRRLDSDHVECTHHRFCTHSADRWKLTFVRTGCGHHS